MSLPAGDEKSLFGQSYAGLITGQMISMRGTSRYTRAQLRDEFAKLKVDWRREWPGRRFPDHAAQHRGSHPAGRARAARAVLPARRSSSSSRS